MSSIPTGLFFGALSSFTLGYPFRIFAAGFDSSTSESSRAPCGVGAPPGPTRTVGVHLAPLLRKRALIEIVVMQSLMSLAYVFMGHGKVTTRALSIEGAQRFDF